MQFLLRGSGRIFVTTFTPSSFLMGNTPRVFCSFKDIFIVEHFKHIQKERLV